MQPRPLPVENTEKDIEFSLQSLSGGWKLMNSETQVQLIQS